MQDLPQGTIDVDHQAASFIADRHRRYAELRDRCPVAYQIDVDGFKPYPGNLLMTGVVSIPVTFTPSARSGAADPFGGCERGSTR